MNAVAVTLAFQHGTFFDRGINGRKIGKIGNRPVHPRRRCFDASSNRETVDIALAADTRILNGTRLHQARQQQQTET